MGIRLLFSMLLILLVTSCSLKYIDHPGPRPEELWEKKGVDRKGIWHELKQCGYNNPTWTVVQQEQVDNCMFEKGFIFIDSPYGEFGSLCKYPDYQMLPSCRSLKK